MAYTILPTCGFVEVAENQPVVRSLVEAPLHGSDVAVGRPKQPLIERVELRSSLRAEAVGAFLSGGLVEGAPCVPVDIV